MGALLLLNMQTLKRVATPLFVRHVRHSIPGCSFTKLQYNASDIVLLCTLVCFSLVPRRGGGGERERGYGPFVLSMSY